MFIHQGDVLCDECGEAAVAAMKMEGKEDTGDSGDFPQEERWGGSSDSPVHCGECEVLVPTDLTELGNEYVAQALIDNSGDCDVLQEWSDQFDLPYPANIGWDAEAVRLWAENLGTAVEGLETFEDAFAGEFNSPEDWAVQYLEDTGAMHEIPEHLRYYFDHSAYARDAELGGDMCFIRSGGSTYAFYNH